MSIWTTAYLAYGLEIPARDTDEVENALRPLTGDVGYLTAGPYDRDRLYLATGSFDADLGTPETLDIPHDPEQYRTWDDQLRTALAALGLPIDQQFTWHLIADQN
ncbi:hypothetical protein ACIGBH_27505 [Streptomyces sp. NPDC085929]|uniref:hypothetical protein n=1 Tax=Streptomyces sp. NPDC085929 TaxID=3365739 RepID=UPI0037D3EEBF